MHRKGLRQSSGILTFQVQGSVVVVRVAHVIVDAAADRAEQAVLIEALTRVDDGYSWQRRQERAERAQPEKGG